MMRFLRTHKKLNLWLLANLGALAAYFLCRGNRAWMNALANGVTTPLKQALGKLCYAVSFSVMEALYVVAGVLAIAYVVWSVAAICRAKGHRGSRTCSAVLGAVNIALSIYAGFCLLWGINYWTDSFQQRSGIWAEPVAAEDLLDVTAYFVEELSASADAVPRDEQGRFAVTWQEILAESPTVYDPLERELPILAFEDPGVKPMKFSRLMSRMDFTGVYCPWTGESNVNVDSPACLIPSTVAHELAHQRGIASEQECNFLAILASVTSGQADYVYSGWLMGYIYLGNALYRADPDSYWQLRNALPEGVKADLADNNAYWDQFAGTVVQKASTTFYDGALKLYGDERGMQSYGTVVDMLVAYYKDKV